MERRMIKVTTGSDFGCEMTDDDLESYRLFTERRLEEIYGCPVEIEILYGQNAVLRTQCFNCPHDVDQNEVTSLVGIELWDEWCRIDFKKT